MATSNLGVNDVWYVEKLLSNTSHFPTIRWYDLGKELGLSKNTLDVIENSFRYDASRCLTECLFKWLSRADDVDSKGGATIDSLINALVSMGEIAVADALKIHKTKTHTIIKNHLPSLSQSLCDPLTIVHRLYEECLLAREVVTMVESASPSVPNQREALLTAVKEAVQNSKSLQTFATVVCKVSTNEQLGLAIQKDIDKYFPPPKLCIEEDMDESHEIESPLAIQVQPTSSPFDSFGFTKSDSKSPTSQPLSPQVEVRVPVPKKLEVKFSSIGISYGRMFYNIRKSIQQESVSLEDMQDILSCCTRSTSLKRKIADCSNISSVIYLLRDECSLTNIGLLECVVEELDITEAKEHIAEYKTKLKEFCAMIKIELCIKERFDSIPHLLWETATFIFDWKPKDHMLQDIENILTEISAGKLMVIKYIEHSTSISVTCSFPLSDVGFAFLRMIENIHILMRQGLKKLAIGNLTLWRRQDVRQKELHKKKQGLQDTEIISFFILEETNCRLRDAISCKEKEAVGLKQKIFVLRHHLNENEKKDLESVDKLITLRSQFNETKKKNKELSDTLDGAKVKYRASLSASSFNDSASSKVRRGMTFEIDDLKFHLEAMKSPDYQPLVESKKMIEELQEKIKLLNIELTTKRKHNEQIQKEIYETRKKIEDKVQPSQEVTVKSENDLQHEAQLSSKTNEKLLSEEEMEQNYGTQLLNSFKDANHDDAIRLLPYVKNHKHLRHQFTIRAASYQVKANLLHMASWNGWLGIIKDLIIKYNCDPHEEDSKGNACLHYAAMGNQVDVMKYLFTEYSDFMAINRDGWTPLHTAAFYGHSEAVEYLLSTGKCELLAKDNLGWTPFKLAKEFGRIDTLTVLKKFGGIKSSHPIDSYVNVLLVGYPGSGKSSFSHVIHDTATGSIAFGSFRKVGGVVPCTAGIIPYKLQHMTLGSIILYDFAGRSEYYSSHSAVIENLLQGSGGVFLIVVNILEKEVVKQLHQWLTVVRNEAQKALNQCHVIVIVSHVDEISNPVERRRRKEEMEEIIVKERCDSVFLDCRKLGGSGVDSFFNKLSSACESIRSTSGRNLSLYCHMMYGLLEERKENILTLSDVMPTGKDNDHYVLPDKREDILDVLHSLHSTGLISILNSYNRFI